MVFRDQNVIEVSPMGANEDQKLLMAAARGDIDGIRHGLSVGASTNIKSRGGDSPLHYSARKGRLDIVNLLLDHGGDCNALNDQHRTPLHDAVSGGHTEVVQSLLSRGADSAVKSSNNLTALDLARTTRRDNVELLRILEEVTPPEPKNTSGWFAKRAKPLKRPPGELSKD